MEPVIVSLPIVLDTDNSHPRGYVTFEISSGVVTIKIEDLVREVSLDKDSFAQLVSFLK